MTLKCHKKSLVDSCLQLLINKNGNGVNKGLKPIKSRHPAVPARPAASVWDCCNRCSRHRTTGIAAGLSSPLTLQLLKGSANDGHLKTFQNLDNQGFLKKCLDEMCNWVSFVGNSKQFGVWQVTLWYSSRSGSQSWTICFSVSGQANWEIIIRAQVTLRTAGLRSRSQSCSVNEEIRNGVPDTLEVDWGSIGWQPLLSWGSTYFEWCWLDGFLFKSERDEDS